MTWEVVHDTRDADYFVEAVIGHGNAETGTVTEEFGAFVKGDRPTVEEWEDRMYPWELLEFEVHPVREGLE
jgi:hypothetical protein